MKTIDLAGEAFTLDADAYHALRNWFDDIRSRLAEGECDEVMEDVESRTVDIFRENLGGSARTVRIEQVGLAIATIGGASSFGERTEFDSRTEPRRRLYRSRHGVLGGVCAGIADYFGIDVSILRLATLLLVFLGGVSVWVYVILWIVLPVEPLDTVFNRYRRGQAERCGDTKRGRHRR